MSHKTPDILVIGGGLHGLSVALHLARSGRAVAVIERSYVGRHASGASAAGVRTLGRSLAEMPLAMESMGLWHQIGDLVGDACGFQANGQLKVVASEAQLAAETGRVDHLRARGYRNEQMIGQNHLRDLVPGINPKFIGAAYAENDGAADPHRTLVAFRAAAERAGVVIHEGAGVTALQRQGSGWRVHTPEAVFAASVVVNAAGAWGARIAALIGEEITLSAKASMMMVTERLAQTIRPVISIAGRSLSFKQSAQGTLVLGGGIQGRYELDSEKTHINFRALAAGAAATQELLPAVAATRIVRCWSGIEGKTDDLLPIIGPSLRGENFYHVFGFSGHGFQLVPAVGAAVAGMIANGAVPETLLPFGVARLARQGVAP